MNAEITFSMKMVNKAPNDIEWVASYWQDGEELVSGFGDTLSDALRELADEIEDYLEGL